MPHTSTMQKLVLISTAILLLVVSFGESRDVHLAKILGIVFASIFLTYGIGQLQISKPNFVTYQNLKRVIYCSLLIVIGFASVIAGIQIFEAYKAKAEHEKALSRELNKTVEEKAREAKAVEDKVKRLRAEEDQQKNEENKMQNLLKSLRNK